MHAASVQEPNHLPQSSVGLPDAGATDRARFVSKPHRQADADVHRERADAVVAVSAGTRAPSGVGTSYEYCVEPAGITAGRGRYFVAAFSIAFAVFSSHTSSEDASCISISVFDGVKIQLLGSAISGTSE